MHRVKVVACADDFFMEKDFELSAVPAEGRTLITLSGRVLLRVVSVSQDLDRNFVTAHCRTDLASLWVLHTSNAGWGTSDAEAFEGNRAVKKAVADREARLEKIRRQGA
jgi:hypothetical protein